MLPAQALDNLPGHIADNVVHFGRVLRAAGLPVGTDRITLALQALQVAGLQSRRDLHATLAACLVDRPEQRLLFDETFHVFWRDPDLLGRMMRMLLPQISGKSEGPPQQENKRLAGALYAPGDAPPKPQSSEPEKKIEINAIMTASDDEVLRKRDFDTMNAEEWRAAKQAIAQLRFSLGEVVTRRSTRAPRGRVDMRAVLRMQARKGALAPWPRKQPRSHPAPIVVLADVSGSMSRYARMLLHFAHALAASQVRRVEVFTFGTRLTRISRSLRQKDPDLAVSQVAGEVKDWSGGTRISQCLHGFNQQWARRVLGGQATVLLVTDGLEFGDPETLAFEAERLTKSCKRLVWLNPLLRFEGFEPKARGIQALLPHVDAFLPAHNIDSLEALVRVLRAG